MLLYRKEPTFIQTWRSSLQSKFWLLPMLMKTKNTEFHAASNSGTHFVSFITIFWKKHRWHLNHFWWGRCRNNSRTYICHLFLSALHTISAGLLYVFFLSVLNGSQLKTINFSTFESVFYVTFLNCNGSIKTPPHTLDQALYPLLRDLLPFPMQCSLKFK